MDLVSPGACCPGLPRDFKSPHLAPLVLLQLAALPEALFSFFFFPRAFFLELGGGTKPERGCWEVEF